MRKLNILIILISTYFSLNAQSMKTDDYQFEGMTMAVTNMDAMLTFYKSVFNVEFEEQEMYGTKLYQGKWGQLNLLFCPAHIAQNTAKQNRHQFDFVVDDLDELIKQVELAGGELMGEITEDEGGRSIGVYDPDRNSILFKQYK